MKKNCRSKHHSYAEKQRVLEQYLTSSANSRMTLTEYSQVCGIPYSTLFGWGKAVGWDLSRLTELKRGQKAEPGPAKRRGLEETLQEKILAIARAQRSWGPLKIKQYLWRHEQILTPQSAIYRLMKEHGLVQERPGGTEEKPSRSFEYPCPLAAVQMDLMQVVLTNRETIHLVTLLDDYSRFVLESRFVAVKTMEEVIDVLKTGIRKYGVMDRLLTDCGAEFVSWHRVTRFEELLVDLGVEYIASGPDQKENQGKLERWHQTVRAALRERGPLDYSSEAQWWIRAMVDHYNYERPHQALGGMVPADRFFGMAEEVAAELDRRRGERRDNRQIYVVCRVGEQKLVVSGRGPEELTVLLDGQAIIRPAERVWEEKKQLEKKAVCGENEPDPNSPGE